MKKSNAFKKIYFEIIIVALGQSSPMPIYAEAIKYLSGCHPDFIYVSSHINILVSGLQKPGIAKDCA